MVVGQVNDQVTVTAEAPLLERETSSLGNIRTEKAIKELPLNLRNVTKLFELTAGTVPLATQSTGLPDYSGEGGCPDLGERLARRRQQGSASGKQ